MIMINKLYIVLILIFAFSSYEGAVSPTLEVEGETEVSHEISRRHSYKLKSNLFIDNKDRNKKEEDFNDGQLVFSAVNFIYSDYEHSDFLERAPPS